MQHPLTTSFIAEIELLAHRNDCLLWAMDSTFTHELFISGTFNRLAKREVWVMYQNQSQDDFNKNFDAITHEHCFEILQERLLSPKFTATYEFILPEGGTQLVHDRSFHFNDADGNCQLIAGVAVPVSESDLSGANLYNITDKLDKITLEYYRLLSLPFEVGNPVESLFSKLTKQQQVILRHILHGLTAKEIAKKTDISFRTVEFHTNAIKDTLGVNSKSELINLAISMNHVAIRL